MKEDLKRIYAESHLVGKYVLIMVVLFILLRILMFLNIRLDSWLSLPQQPGTLITRPWTLFTYMFTHVDTRHIFWNMVLLWSAGRIFCDMLGEKRFVKTFWLGGILGGIFYLLAYNFMPSLVGLQSTLLGASAAVLSVLVSVTVYRPEYMVALPLIGQVKLLYITLILLVITLPLGHANFGGDMAHLGGITWGFYYGIRLRSSVEPATWFDRLADSVMNRVDKSASAYTSSRKKKAKMKVYTSTEPAPVPRDDKEYNAMKKAQQDRVDRILEKISKSGYESLTSEEKTILFKASNKGKDA